MVQSKGVSFLSDPMSHHGTHLHFPMKWKAVWFEESGIIQWKQVSGKME